MVYTFYFLMSYLYNYGCREHAQFVRKMYLLTKRRRTIKECNRNDMYFTRTVKKNNNNRVIISRDSNIYDS